MEPEQPIQETTSKKGPLIAGAAILAIIIIAGVLMAKGRKEAAPDITVDQRVDGSTEYSNDEGTVVVGGNTLPDNWPSDAPAYPNASIQYSGSSNPQTGEAGAAVVFTTTDSAANVIEFYKRELAAQGWTIEQTATVGVNTVLAAKKGEVVFGVSIVDAGNGQVTVTAGISTPSAK